MPSQNGRDFLIKIGDGASTEIFTTLGAARANTMVVNNNPVDDTTMDDAGVQKFAVDAGVQTMQMTISGLFKDGTAEELLRTAAMNRTQGNYQLAFPNGDIYEASFVIQDYNRGGEYDGLESFSATLIRSGDGVFTSAP